MALRKYLLARLRVPLRTCISLLCAGRPTRARPAAYTRPGVQGMRARASFGNSVLITENEWDGKVVFVGF